MAERLDGILLQAKFGLAIGLLTTACTVAPPTSPAATVEDVPRGGTLATAFTSRLTTTLDPHSPEAFLLTFELHRCCLSRTLMSYPGRPTEEGGTVVQPDLASSMPEVSRDGLTWTFRLRPDIRYAPPLQGTSVTSPDVIRALERYATLDPVFAESDYGPIVGMAEFAAGSATTIAGLETPDDQTLVVRLTAPNGEMPDRFASPVTAPIPPNPSRVARFGVADGHDADWERFMVGTGPYMIERTAEVDFSLPAAEHQPLSGYQPGASVVLVRNPSWDASTDGLRPAYVERMEVSIGSPDENVDLAARVDEGTLHLVIQPGPPPQAPLEQIEAYQSNEQLRERLFINDRNTVRFLSMNLAMPPFDDVHVRRAVNYAIDKAQLTGLVGGPVFGRIAGHLAVNSLTDNLLLEYDPFATPDHRGDLDLAREEMRQSRYDSDANGTCDHAACEGLRAVSHPLLGLDPEVLAQQLARIGIGLDVEAYEDVNALFEAAGDPSQQIAMTMGISLIGNPADASSFFNLFTKQGIAAGSNYSLVGADSGLLAESGYAVTDVPNIDARLAACTALVGAAQAECWAELDQYLTQEVVPWVPYFFEGYVRTVSADVAHYSFDQSVGLPALDQIAIVAAE
jgi:peptide/nickel transport system substrate-binding protein